jgi:excisionase family DNA binding protein
MFTDTPSAKLLSIGDVAKLLRLHPHSAYRKIHAGELPAVRLGEDGARCASAATDSSDGSRPTR